MRARLAGLDARRLRLALGLFFLALALPTAVLVRQAYLQLRWESFHQHQALAEELSARIGRRAKQWIDAEEARSFSDYAFLIVAGDPAANFVQRSPLSDYPPKSALPGLVGYFQVDAQGLFSSPLLPGAEPAVYGIVGEELAQRQAAQARILDILSRNRLLRERNDAAEERPGTAPASPAPALQEAAPARPAKASANLAPPSPPLPAQAAFDRLSQASADQDKQDRPAADEKKQRMAAESDSAADSLAGQVAKLAGRAGRKEKSALPEPAPKQEAAKAAAPVRVTTFESEIDPFEFNRLASGHFVLFRKVWRDGQRYIQGLLVEPEPFLRGLVEAEFRATALSRMSELAVMYRGGRLAAMAGVPERDYLDSGQALRGDLLYRTRLSAPLDEVELDFTLARLPAGPGGRLVGWLAGVLALVLCGGFWLMYRLGLRLILLARQQQDFVSAVSHELKTPLTSIRMYGEMLKAGWVPEEKKAVYYEYIYAESERLSRLIANVLQLARLTRNRLEVELKPMGVAELMDGVRSKVGAQVERAGYVLTLACAEDAASARILVDADYFAQIIINLVDNALKFSAKSPRKEVEVGCRLRKDKAVVFSVRDYGPGVPKDQAKKIFGLFYRPENEMARETTGTGIGLALVRQLALAMGAQVELANREVGAEFQLIFRRAAMRRGSPAPRGPCD